MNPTSGDLLGLVRTVDLARRSHRISLGRLPGGTDAWELGALPREDPGGGIPVWIDREDELTFRPSPGASANRARPAASRPRPADVARWTFEPLIWKDSGAIAPRLRATARRAMIAAGYALAPPRSPTAVPERPPDGWLYPHAAVGRVALHAARHPVTGRQIVTRDAHESRELGYGESEVIGWLLAEAPVTGSLVRPPQRLPWSSHFGATLTGGGDPITGAAPSPIPMLFPPGHFYSPVPDPGVLFRRRERLWPPRSRPTPGIDWCEDEQLALCRAFTGQTRMRFPHVPGGPSEYWIGNDQFPPLDAWVLEAMLGHLQPRRVIEVGCGFSSLVTARVNRERRESEIHFTCIEPYPRQFLLDGVGGITELRVELIQDTPVEVFASLEDGDILFIDSSHVVRTGSDVVWLFEEIVPRLAAGVAVHVHDMFLPGEYPEAWVAEGRGWNEQYLVRAFLAFNNHFRILWSNAYMLEHHPEALREAFPEVEPRVASAGSLWMQRLPEGPLSRRARRQRSRHQTITFVTPNRDTSSGGIYAIHEFAARLASIADITLAVEDGDTSPLHGVEVVALDHLTGGSPPAADALVIPADSRRGADLFALPSSAGLPVVLLQGFGTPGSPVVEANVARAAGCLAGSRWLAATAAERGLATQRFHYGLDRHAFHPGPSSSRRSPTVAMITTPVKWKAMHDGLAALRLAKDEVPELEVVLFGHVDPALPWATFVPGLSGNRAEIGRTMRDAMVFVVPSWEEGYGLPGLEALACGAALASTDTRGSSEYAVHDRTALVSPPRDVDALAANVVRLVTDVPLRERLVLAGYERAAEAPGWSEAASGVADGLARLLAASSSSGVAR